MFKTLVYALEIIWRVSGADEKLRLYLNTVFAVVRGVLIFAIPLLLAFLIDGVTPGKTQQELLSPLYMLAGAAVALVVLNFFYRRYLEQVELQVENKVKLYFFQYITNMPTLWHTNHASSYLAVAVNQVAASINLIIRHSFWQYIPNLIVLLLFIVFSFYKSPGLAIYLIIFMFCILAFARLSYDERNRRINLSTKEKLSTNKKFIDFFANVKTLRKGNCIDFAVDFLSKSVKKVNFFSLRSYHYNSWQWGIVEIAVEIMFLLPIFYFTAQFATTGEGLGYVVLMVSIRKIAADFVGFFLNFLLNISRHRADFDLLEQTFRDKMNSNELQHGADQVPAVWQAIRIEKLEYRYQDSDAQVVIDKLLIEKGDKLALVGSSGSGKTTLLHLLTNNLIPDSGSIAFDDVDFNQISPRFFQDEIAFASQDSDLFDLSLRENILLNNEIEGGQLEQLIAGCQLTSLVQKLDGNLDAPLGERGAKISGGEKQRIILARALVMDRPILVLDEITANLDSKTAEAIWKFVFKRYQDKTIIMSTHTQEALNYVDKIIQLKDGKLSK